MFYAVLQYVRNIPLGVQYTVYQVQYTRTRYHGTWYSKLETSACTMMYSECNVQYQVLGVLEYSLRPIMIAPR